MNHVLEHQLGLAEKKSLADQSIDSRSPGMDIADDRGIVQIPDVMDVLATPYLDPRMLGLRMDVQQQPAGSERPVNCSQSVDDALRRYSSERPGEDGHVEGISRQADVRNIGHPERDNRPEGLGGGGDPLFDALRLGIERQDRACALGVAPRHPAIAATNLQDVLAVEVDHLVEGPRFVALWINCVAHCSIIDAEGPTMVKIHLDTDLGGDMDDLCALAMLLKWPDVEITGITTVAELDGRRAGYVRYALDLAGRPDIPVAAGADASCGRFRSAVELPDEEAYWPEPIAPAPTPLADALALLKRSIEAGAHVVAIGPFTNLALLDEAHPGLLAQAGLTLMGGHLYPVPPGFPQWDNSADWNVQYDVTSARHVLERYSPTLVPLEVTVQTVLRRAYLPALRAAGPLGRLLARQAGATAKEYRNEGTYGRTCAGLPDDIINFQHDPLACAVALGWDGVTRRSLHVGTELRDGWLHERVDEAGREMSVVTAVDGARFNDRWLNVVTA